MEHHKPIILGVVVGYNPHKLHPRVGPHLRGVEHGIELIGGNGVAELLQLRHIVAKMLKVERLEHSGFRVLNHTDCAAGVDK